MAFTNQNDATLFGQLLQQARPCWPHLLGILCLSLLAPPLALLAPLPIKIAVDSVIGTQPLPEFLNTVIPTFATQSATALLVLSAALVVVIGLLMYVQGLAVWLLETYAGEKLVLDFRAQLFRHVQRLSLSYHDRKGTTDSIYRIQYDAPAIQWILINGMTPFVTSVLTLAGMIYVTAHIELQLALVALVVSPVLFILTRSSSRRLRRHWDKIKEYESSAMSVVQEVLTSMRVVKAFGQEDREHERFVHHASKGMWGQMRLAFIAGGFDLFVGVTIAVGTAAVLFIGVRHVQAGTLTLGNLLLVMAYLAQLYGPLQTISKKVVELQSSLSSAGRAFSLLAQMTDVPERQHAKPIERAKGAITFENVSFAYAEGQYVLRDASFEVNPGSLVGIIGATGAGKTTLVSLLTRFYDPTAGAIYLDGVDLREYKLADLRNQCSLVLQDPVLFSTTIAENIAYARPGSGEERIIEAAKAANAHEFIMSLPHRYETQVGERGMSLSGGERQRISLARAFVKDAPILILDEPTSAVDVRTEAFIIEAMEKLLRSRTTFIITHRISMLKNCNTILRIEDGCVRDATNGEGISTQAGTDMLR